MVLDIAVNDKLNYVIQSDLVGFDSPFVDVPFHNDEVGLNQYLIYTVNDQVGIGAQVEWWASDSGFNHGGQSIPLGGTHSYYEATFGVNVRPNDNIIIRPEYRKDRFPHSSYDNDIFAIDVIITL